MSNTGKTKKTSRCITKLWCHPFGTFLYVLHYGHHLEPFGTLRDFFAEVLDFV